MPFIPNKIENGTKVVLTKDVRVLKGTFTAGTEMTITGDGYRGYDLVDEFGNTLGETPSSCFRRVD